jgi:hypothetical protein
LLSAAPGTSSGDNEGSAPRGNSPAPTRGDDGDDFP